MKTDSSKAVADGGALVHFLARACSGVTAGVVWMAGRAAEVFQPGIVWAYALLSLIAFVIAMAPQLMIRSLPLRYRNAAVLVTTAAVMLAAMAINGAVVSSAR